MSSTSKKNFHILGCVESDTTLKHSERSIYKMMSGYSRYGHQSINPAYSVIAKHSGYSERHTKRAVKRLIELGYLKLISRGGWRRMARNRYKVVIPESYKLHKREINEVQKVEIAKAMLVKFGGISKKSIDDLLIKVRTDKIRDEAKRDLAKFMLIPGLRGARGRSKANRTLQLLN